MRPFLSQNINKKQDAKTLVAQEATPTQPFWAQREGYLVHNMTKHEKALCGNFTTPCQTRQLQNYSTVCHQPSPSSLTIAFLYTDLSSPGRI